MKSRRLISSLILLTVLITNNHFTVDAAPTSKDYKNQIISIDLDIDKMELDMEMTDHKIETLTMQLQKQKQQMDTLNKSINDTNTKVTAAKKDVTKNTQLMNNRLRAMYINGNASYIACLLNSKTMSDLVSNVDNVSRVIALDQSVVEKTKESKNKLEKLSSDLLTDKSDLDKLVHKTDEANTLLKIQKESQKVSLAKLNSMKGQLQEKEKDAIAREKREAEELKKKLEQERLAAIVNQSKQSSSRGSNQVSRNNNAIASGSAVVNYAMNFIGTPYVWGGNTPNPGFDCSGFMQYVYAHFGVSIGRTTYDQINDGVAVSRDQLQPGDLILFGSSEDPHHVGMYVGDGKYIHAPKTGDHIKISDLSGRGDYLTARRVR